MIRHILENLAVKKKMTKLLVSSLLTKSLWFDRNDPGIYN